MPNPNGVVHTYGYDNRNRLTNLGVAKGTNQLAGYSYLLDASGHRLSVTELSGRTVTYGYDNLYRLTNETIAADPSNINGAVNYTYDPVGNRKQLTSTLAPVPAGLWNHDANDQLSSDHYDSNGNTRISGGQVYSYDFENHLIQRSGLTSSTGAITDTYDYDAFGILIHSTGSTPNLYRYSGEQFDPDLGLYYNRARYLNVSTGRFWTMDLADGDDSSPVSLHKYAYVGANPVDRTDTSGNSIDEELAAVALFVTINTIPLPNYFHILQNAPRQETLYVRSFAPWDWFGAEPPICFYNCFRGNNRSFTTSRDKGVTSKATGILNFVLPSMSLTTSPTVYSDQSGDVYGRTATATPSIGAVATGNGKLHMEFAAANPLVPSPDIDTKLDLSADVKSGQVCYSGHLYGDAFPNAEVFVVNSHDQATMLLTFATTGGRNTGPIHFLPGNNNRDMGSFSAKCSPE